MTDRYSTMGITRRRIGRRVGRHLEQPGRRGAVAVFVVGVLLTTVLAAWLWVDSDAEARARLETQPQSVVESTRLALDTVADRLVSVAGLFRASGDVTIDEFEQFAADIGLVPGIEAIAYVAAVPSFDLVEFETAMAGDGPPVRRVFSVDERGTPVPRSSAGVYYPLRFAYPRFPWGEYRGLDLGANAFLGPDFAAALDHDEIRMSDFFPVPGGETDTFALLLAIDHPGDRGALGFAAALMDSGDLLDSNIPSGLEEHIDWELVTAPATAATGSAASASLDYGHRTWQIRVMPKPGSPFLPDRTSIVAVVAFGLLASVLAASSALLYGLRRHAAAELATEREVMAAKDRFIASVSHELRTPLTGVMGFAEVLRDAPDAIDPRERAEMMRIIARQAEDLGHIIDDLLVAAGGEMGPLHIAPVAMSLTDELATLRAGGGLDGVRVVERHGSHGLVIADPVRVRQIIRNLVDNARIHGGPDVEVTLSGDGSRVCLSVSDDGPGVSADRVAEIFQPYGRLGRRDGRPEQIGIGLSVSRLLAHSMHGDLRYERIGGRTVFTLALPVTRVAAAV